MGRGLETEVTCFGLNESSILSIVHLETFLLICVRHLPILNSKALHTTVQEAPKYNVLLTPCLFIIHRL